MALSDPERDVDCVGDRESVNGLKYEREAQPLLQFDHDGDFLASQRHDVAGRDLALHHIALRLEEALDWAVKFDLSHL